MTSTSSVEVAIANSKHSIVGDKSCNRFECVLCRSSILTKDDSNLRNWLASDRVPVPTAFTRPEPLGTCVVQLGKLTTHVSHSIWIYKGLIYCNRCGNRGGGQIPPFGGGMLSTLLLWQSYLLGYQEGQTAAQAFMLASQRAGKAQLGVGSRS